MKKMMLTLLVLLLLLFSGCAARKAADNSVPLASSITVTCHSCAGIRQRYYSQPEKMRQILHYIRRLEPMPDTAEVPGTLGRRYFSIHIRMTDGSSRFYRQKDTAYFQSGSGPWQKMGRGKGSRLWQLMLELPEDAVPFRLTTLPRFCPPGHACYCPALRRLKIPDK